MMWAPLRLMKRKNCQLLIVIIIVSIIFILVLIRNDKNPPLPEDRPDWIGVRLDKGQKQYVDRRGIRVIVGHYMGPDLKNVNLNKSVLNSNDFLPMVDAGKDGGPVMLSPSELLKTQQLFQINSFNLVASDRIPLNRTLRDVRNHRCKARDIDLSNLPTASVIIVFHNEAWSTLLRTVWSVINRSPKQLLKQIVLVDDASEREFLGAALEQYISTLPVKTTLIRIKERSGLIRARIAGAKQSVGSALVFLDAHCECTIGWLESLLDRIAEDRTRVVCPVIDIINKDTFAYTKIIESSMGAFNWHLTFRWFYLSNDRIAKRGKDMSQPILTPAMAGGLFAIDRKYFFEIGSYDTQMYIWGGENIEISFRIWQCGGSIEIIPCSHVGHVFRLGSPYAWPGGSNQIISRNFARIALVWMDEWSDFYFKFSNKTNYINDVMRGIDVNERKSLRKDLKCKSFDWYLKNIWPENCLPRRDSFFGRITNKYFNKCVCTKEGQPQDIRLGSSIVHNCSRSDDSVEEMFVFVENGTISTNECVCLETLEDRYKKTEAENSNEVTVRLHSCNGSGRQKWRYDKTLKQVIHIKTGLCLVSSAHIDKEAGLTVKPCSQSNVGQQWELEEVQWKKNKSSSDNEYINPS